MESPNHSIDFQLKLDLSDADFLALVRDTDPSRQDTGTPRSNVQATTNGETNQKPRYSTGALDSRTELHSAEKLAAASPLENRGKPSSSGKVQTDIFATYSARRDTFTLTGMLNKRYPVRLLLKSGSRTYTNFVRLLHRELDSIEARSQKGTDWQITVEARKAVDALKRHLETVLKDLSQETMLNVEGLSDIVDLYRVDFEAMALPRQSAQAGRLAGLSKDSGIARQSHAGFRVTDEATGEAIVDAPWPSQQRTFRFFGDTTPQLISGFLGLDEAEPRHESSEDKNQWFASKVDWKSSLRFDPTPRLVVENHGVRVAATIYLPQQIIDRAEVFVHWGPYSDVASWRDEEISAADVTKLPGGALRISKHIVPEIVGTHGACFCVKLRGVQDRAWSSEYDIPDVRFEAPRELVHVATPIVRERRSSDTAIKSKLLDSLSSFSKFIRVTNQLLVRNSDRRLGSLLHNITKNDQELRTLLSSYYEDTVAALESQSSELPAIALRRVERLVRNIGIGEVVLVAPEGPHAIAGGLAQVIVGLSKSLAQEGVCSTVITPLYEKSQGNKHASAEDVIRNGVQLFDKVVPLKDVGEIKIPFGGTRVSGTLATRQFPRVVSARVYLAEHAGIRVFFLRHPTLAERLYQFRSSEDQLRKALFLSRGSLELIRDRRFDISPDTIMSNDWQTALIPALLRCDERYCGHGPFIGVESAHVIHNAGPAFQGRFFVNQFGEDLWPVLGLGEEHFFGLADPANRAQFNLTAGAILHSSKAVVTVSKPYAQQLLTEEGGEGLHKQLEARKDTLFGISNGVDLAALRTTFRELGEKAREKLGLPPALRGARVSEARILAKLRTFKAASKALVQQKFGLEQGEETILITMVGRLAEQKGVQLLTCCEEGSSCSVMEQILQAFPQVQFLIAGPLSDSEPEIQEFEKVFTEVRGRYPHRVRGEFNFVPHREALEITHASDFFLMPSRYEPGGITQLEALAAGSLVIAHNVGGIAATLRDYSTSAKDGTSFLFNTFSCAAFHDVVCRALQVFEDSTERRLLITQAALARNDWSDRVPTYLALLQHVSGSLSAELPYPHLKHRIALLNSVRARF